MNLNIKDKLFVVTGATSGFGKSIALRLIAEGARVILNARGEEKLISCQQNFPDQVEFVAGDITTDAVISKLMLKIGARSLDGIVVNAGGPPAKSFMSTALEDWDNAYRNILRWKVKLSHTVLPKFIEQQNGNIVFIESASVKQPIENLVLSNSLRLAVVGFVKTLSQEVGNLGITMNIIAPGYHATPAMERLYKKKATILGIDPLEAKAEFEKEIKSQKLGDPDDLASLAAWLLSPLSSYVTGQTISVDGGLIKSTMG